MLKDLDAHLADVTQLARVGAPAPVALAAALGRVLASDVLAPHPLPAFASSAMDGYAVRAADVPGHLRVVGDVPAGHVPTAVVAAGTAVRVMTGALLPAGTEAVVPVEATDGGLEVVTVDQAAAAGAYVRPAGGDCPAGAVVLAAGSTLTASRLAVLAAVGHLTPLVRARPRVLVVSTGDELVEAGAEAGPAQLVDSNRPALLAAITEAGGEGLDGGLVGDDPADLLAALTAQPADLVLTTGGVSVGAYDVVKAVLQPLGVRFERVALQPGMPQAWGHLPDGTPVLGLPGNPVSALVSWELFGRAAIGRPRPRWRSVLTAPVSGSPADKAQLLRVTLDERGATPVGGTGSHLLAALGAADALAVVPCGTTELPAGAGVTVIGLG